jgi:hypothetical protein
MVSEAYGHIPGTERNTLVREIVKVYNEIGNKDKIRFTDFHNAAPYKDARQYVDQEGLNHWVKEYLIQLKLVRKGLSCELEDYVVKGIQGKPSYDIVYENLAGIRKAGDNRLEYDDDPTGGFDVNGAFTIEGTTGGVTAKFNSNGTKLQVQGKGTVTLRYNWNDIPGYKSKALDSITIAGTKWTQADVRRGTEVHTISVNSVSKPDITKQRNKKITPLSEEKYLSYKNDLNQKPEPTAFACMKKLIWAGFKEAARKQGPIVREQTYCDWAREYVDEVQDIFRPTTTIGYELPCGGEITAPQPTGEKPPTHGDPTILVPKTVEIPCTGMGYTSGDTLNIGGVDTPFKVDPDGRIINIDVPKLGPQLDYPVVEINTNTGAGADIELTLEAIPVTSEMDVLPADIVEVIDCVGKNIFIKES